MPVTTREGVWRSGPRRPRSHDHFHLSHLPQVLVCYFQLCICSAVCLVLLIRPEVHYTCIDVITQKTASHLKIEGRVERVHLWQRASAWALLLSRCAFSLVLMLYVTRLFPSGPVIEFPLLLHRNLLLVHKRINGYLDFSVFWKCFSACKCSFLKATCSPLHSYLKSHILYKTYLIVFPNDFGCGINTNLLLDEVDYTVTCHWSETK